MRLLSARYLAVAVASAVAVIAAACGGSDSTVAPQPTAAPTRAAPSPTQFPAATPTLGPTVAPLTATPAAPTATATARPPGPTPTSAPATPTRVPPTATPAPTPTPAGAVPTAIVKQPTKRGGTLQLRTLSAVVAYDTFDVGGGTDFHHFGPMLNNLIWPDPYGKELTGDIAEDWSFSDGGKVVTFRLRKGIKFQDGTPLTSKDILYNIERGRNPRDPRMTAFKTRFSSMQKVEAPDDSTFRVTLAAPSNVLLLAMGGAAALMYPSHLPFPEKKEEWKKAPVGSGPFKVKSIDPSVKIEYVKYDGYFKTGMPYVDGMVLTVMTNEVAVASFRTGRLDATNLDSTPTINQLTELKKAFGWVPVRLAVSIPHAELNQKPPFTDVRVREAVFLALDRQALVDIWLRGEGSPFSASLLPPENSGQWGVSAKDLENRPGYSKDKTKDLARAKQLMKDSGIDPSKFPLAILGSNVYPPFAEVVESGLRELGFKSSIFNIATADLTERLVRGDFDVNANSPTFTFDDPNDRLASQVTTTGPFNYGKWSNPKLDQLLDEQDRVLDSAKRRAMLLEAQETVLTDRVYIPMAIRYGYHGYMPYVKNFPTNTPFLFSPAFRWEQVWLEK